MASIEAVRTTGERALAKLFKGLQQSHKRKIKAAVRKYGTVGKIPKSFWIKLQDEIDSEVAAALLLIFIAAHESTQNRLRFKVEADTLKAKAQVSVKARAKAVAKAYVTNTRKRIVGKKPEDMNSEIDTALNDGRAEGVAVTETTGAISGGQGSASDDYEEENPSEKTLILWVTEKDARVCPICRPLHMKREKVWASRFPDGPPAHPNCRCRKLITKGG